ncbi:DUF2062 domain-containing protein [Sphingobacterium hungaricum]|uniref:DUF2062 domain-containing protein n=1 Tax=Sphingobacterium hungaricum TaxID=2082723 RepID=A0A928UZF8_9SPHI|nr:DUF2062 domain-containing protein [Sphingobacterium hungaricum]MBE8713889.1 DUF2062 domain-containing protein [Sphingobacterium hungaricum]
MISQHIIDSLARLNVVIIIPTYNNHKTLNRVIDNVLPYQTPVIVVNDGSTDSTSAILKNYGNRLKVISFARNQGKGMALRAGFAEAKKLGFGYAITIDSDGQHYPSDIPVFVEELEKAKHPILLIGSRNMTHDSVPKKSSFGNRFSNFWFWFETGIKLTDTQSGFRAYPLRSIPNKFYTKKFEFEIEVIVRTAWNGVEVKNVPIQVLYDPNERVSHFRPFKDFTRISILNTVLVFLTFFYILPRNFFRSFKKKSLDKFVKENVFGSEDSPAKKATSIALGVFMGIAPVWGFQTALVITLAVFLRLNKVLAFAFSNISLPPMIPFIIYASLLVGGLVLPAESTFHWRQISFETIQLHLVQYVIGSLVLALSMALLIGFGCYAFFKTKANNTISAD